MNNQLRNSQEAYEEALTIAKFQGIDGPDFRRKIKELAKHFDTYAEFMLSEYGFEAATMGDINAMAETAQICGASTGVVEAFVKCARAFPGKKLAIKVYFGPNAELPSLYARVMAPCREGLNFLTTLPDVADLVPALEEFVNRHQTMYYIGFKGNEECVWLKTYHISNVQEGRKIATGQKDNGHFKENGNARQEEPGFVCYRVCRGQPIKIKYYMANVGWDEVTFSTPRWQKVADFAQNQMGYREISSFGVFEQPAGPPQLKLYVERIGAIPTEYDAR